MDDLSIEMHNLFTKTLYNYYKDKEMNKFDGVKDSGKREEMVTGSVRDTREGKGRYDLIPPYPVKRLAQHYENGAVKYGDRNWEKGQSLMRFLDSAMRHLQCVVAGEGDEDHESAVLWNVMGYMDTLNRIEQGKLPIELDDRPDFKLRKFDCAKEVEKGKRENLIEHGMFMDDDDELVDFGDGFAEENLPTAGELFEKIFNSTLGIDKDILDMTDPKKRKYLHVMVYYDSKGACYLITDKYTYKAYYLNLTMNGTSTTEEHAFPYEEANFLYWIIGDEKIVGMAGSDIEVGANEIGWGMRLAPFTNKPKG